MIIENHKSLAIKLQGILIAFNENLRLEGLRLFYS